jgi:hypothetical protein
MSEIKKAEAEEEIEAEIVDDTPEDRFPWAVDDEERCRSFIAEVMANADIDGKVMVWNMELVYLWVRSHVVPPEAQKKNVGNTTTKN